MMLDRGAEEGPSPLARGKLLSLLDRGRLVGTIPARAGETGSDGIHSSCFRDHPRSRGGNAPVALCWP